MHIKKYVAASLKEATVQMKNDLGKDAVILGTRIIDDENNRRQKLYEITAGLDNFEFDDTSKQKAVQKSLKNSSSYEDELRSLRNKIYNSNQKRIESTYGKIDQEEKVVPPAKISINSKLKSVVKNLTEKEVQKSVILSLIEQLKKYKNFLTDENLENYLLNCIAALTKTKSFDLTERKKGKVVALVGSTGVGKTTTIAKLALIAKIIHKLDVGLISVDTYRLGAVDQLRSFADISHIDFLVAYEPEEMTGLIKKFSKKDIIFIDTVGRNQNNINQLNSNLEFLSAVKVDETYLVLSATSSSRTIIEASKKFKIFNYNAFILSKIDEAVVHGNILNLVSKTETPITFLTNGQTIPDDIIAADKDSIANLILTGQLS
jgi:flagellar biosynthesis protein FlhF